MRNHPPHKQAGSIIRLLAWIALIPSLLVFVSMLLSSVRHDLINQTMLGYLLFVGVLIALGIFQLHVGNAVREHRDWARIHGIGFGIMWLFAFPIGTITGAYILLCLIKAWDGAASVEPESGT